MGILDRFRMRKNQRTIDKNMRSALDLVKGNPAEIVNNEEKMKKLDSYFKAGEKAFDKSATIFSKNVDKSIDRMDSSIEKTFDKFDSKASKAEKSFGYSYNGNGFTSEEENAEAERLLAEIMREDTSQPKRR